jgi:hypothetical protein
MNRRLVVPIGLAALMGALILTACQAPPAGAQAQADAKTVAACQKRADQAYETQNRGAIYSPPPTVNTPFSANYIPDDTGRGLPTLYAHDRMVSDCIRNTGTNTQRTPPPPGAKSY